jgi:predicted small lipoprotein YifL
MKSTLVHSLALAVLVSLTACGGPVVFPLEGSHRVPSAQGSVAVEPAENGNTRLTVEVKHLAYPEKVWRDAKVYVVWVQPPNGPPQNVGALHVDDNLYGRLTTITPFQSFELLITPEPSPAVLAPRGSRILSTMVSL